MAIVVVIAVVEAAVDGVELQGERDLLSVVLSFREAYCQKQNEVTVS